jgi:TRAP transporter TAXI family solute receptor
MIRALWRHAALLALVAAHAAGVHAATTGIGIVTGSPRGTVLEMAQDLAALVAPGAEVALDVLPSREEDDNLSRLRHERGVKLAIVQSDVYQSYLDRAARGDAQARDVLRPLRVVMPLHDEELALIVRADSELDSIDDIRDARINLGEKGSGSATTVATLYRRMFGTPIAPGNASWLSEEQALVRLITDKTVDVVAVVAGQPARLLADMKPEARRFIKLLRFDEADPTSASVLRAYPRATIRAGSYPNLLEDDVDTIAVPTLLVTAADGSRQTSDALVRLMESLCRNFEKLQRNGHPKWREVELRLPEQIGGMPLYQPTAKALAGCIADRVGRPAVR